MKAADWITMLSLLVAIEMAIGHGTIALTNAISDKLIPRVQAWCNILAGIGSLMITALSRYAGAILLAILLLSGGGTEFAVAQNRIGGPAGQALDKLGVKPIGGQGQGSNENAGTILGGGDRAQSLLDKPFQDLANFIGDDIDAAIALSTVIPSLQDGNGQQCAMDLKTFGEVIKAHPAPLTFKVATDLEAFRLKQMAVNRLCASTACTVVFADITQTITALSPMPLPIPSLHDLCSKVPTITVVAPVANVTPAAAPKP